MSRTGLLGLDQTTTPNYATEGSDSNVPTVTDGDGNERSLKTILAKANTGILTGTVTSDEYKAIQLAATRLATLSPYVSTDDLGFRALTSAYESGDISDDAYLLLAPLGSPLPASPDAVIYSDWETLATALGATTAGEDVAVMRGTAVALASKQFAVPKKKGVSIGVEYRLKRSADTAISAHAATGSTVFFVPDWSQISETAVSDNKYKITVVGKAYQENSANGAAIAANTFEYRYVLRISNPKSPSIPNTYQV